MLVRLALAVALSAAALAGCSDDDATGAVDALAGIYAVQTVDGWEVQEAVDPAADDPLTERERPPLDWYAATVLPVVALVTSRARRCCWCRRASAP